MVNTQRVSGTKQNSSKNQPASLKAWVIHGIVSPARNAASSHSTVMMTNCAIVTGQLNSCSVTFQRKELALSPVVQALAPAELPGAPARLAESRTGPGLPDEGELPVATPAWRWG